MRKFVAITASNAELLVAYQQFVASNGMFTQDSAWGDFRAHYCRGVHRFAVVDNGTVLASVQVLETSALGRGYFYAPYGPVFSTSDTSEAADLFGVLSEGIHDLYPSIIFLRVEPHFELGEPAARWGVKSQDLSPHQTLVLDLTKTADQLMAEMHTKTRYNIHVAEKHNVEVRVEAELSVDAAKLLMDTSHRAGIRGYSAEYYRTLVSKISGGSISAKVYCAYFNGELIAANVMLSHGTTCVYLFGGSSSSNRNVMAPYLLHWHSIRDAKAAGMLVYDFWGVETDPNHPWSGFSRFKLGFGGEVKKFGGTYDAVFSPAWYNIYNTLRKLNKSVRSILPK